MLRSWNDLPDYMKCEEVQFYYKILQKKKASLVLKRIFDVVMGIFFLIILAVPMVVIAVMIKFDSKGPVFYRQERVTAYGKKFKIHKFRTMADHSDKMGTAITVENDIRITKTGKKLRDYRLDEIPQLFDVLAGNMSFVGTRPEAVKYVKKYTKEMYATLLLPAGITSEASIQYKDEAKLLVEEKNIDRVYVEKILPEKMKYNLDCIRDFSFFGDIWIMVKTVAAVVRQEKKVW